MSLEVPHTGIQNHPKRVHFGKEISFHNLFYFQICFFFNPWYQSTKGNKERNDIATVGTSDS